MSKELKSLIHPWKLEVRQNGFAVTNGIGDWFSKSFTQAWWTFTVFSRRFPTGKR